MKTCLSRLLLSLLLLLLSGVSAFALENRVSEKILCAETVPEENTVLQPLPRLENNCFLTKGLSDTRYQFAGNMANNLLSNQNNQGHARSTTQAAVSEGALIIRNQDKQQQNLAELRRDVEQANPRLSAIFDKEKEQQRLKTAQLIGEIGNQASDIARTEGAIAAEKAQRNPQARETAKAALVTKGNLSPTERQITEQARHTAMADYGTGSPLQQGMQAATAAIQGLAGGDLKSAIAGGSAPYLAEVIKKTTPDEPSRVMAHAVVAGALAQMQGNNPVAGASGAAAGEIAASVIKAQLYPDKNVSALSESEKQTVSTLSTLASGLAGGIAGDSTASAVAGAQAGKTVVENNYLGAIAQGGKLAVEGCTKTPACRNKLIEGGLGALIGAGKVTSAVEQLSDNQKTNVMLAAISGNTDLIDKLSGAERKAYDELKGNQGLITVFPTPERDPTGGKLINPIPDQNKGTALITPDQSGAQGASHTGNTDGKPDTGVTTTTTPIADAPSRDELVYTADKYKPNQGAVGNMGEFFKQPGFGSEVKDNSRKTNRQYQGQSVYKSDKPIGDFIKKGDQLYLDAKHKNHIEVFDSTGTKVQAVLNLDGSYNDAKTKAARAEGRRLPK